MRKRHHIGTFTIPRDVHNAWNSIDIVPNADSVDAMRQAHRADIRNTAAMEGYWRTKRRQQAFADLRARLDKMRDRVL